MKQFKSPHTGSMYAVIAENEEMEVYVVSRYVSDKNDCTGHYRVAIYAPPGILMQVNPRLHGCEWSTEIKSNTHLSATIAKSEYSNYIEQAIEGLRTLTDFPAIFPTVGIDIDPANYLDTMNHRIECPNCGCSIVL